MRLGEYFEIGKRMKHIDKPKTMNILWLQENL